MSTTPGIQYDDYKKAMDGIAIKVAMQTIRKIMRGNDTEEVKLAKVSNVIHDYENDAPKL